MKSQSTEGSRQVITLVAYVPVLHRGYLELFEKYRGERLCVLAEEVLQEFPQLLKDIRALKARQAALMIQALEIFSEVRVFGQIDLANLETFMTAAGSRFVMPDEEECRLIAGRWLNGISVEFESVFLRYDRKRAAAENEVFADITVTDEEAHQKFMKLASNLAIQSPDWWRQIGAVLIKDGEVLLTAYNTHVPSNREALFHGDPRANFRAGVEIEASLVLHAEAAIVAEAARRKDVSLEGASLYVTTFPCAPCAKQVAYSGVKEIYFRDGYSRTDGWEILKARGVRVIRVNKMK